MVAKYWNKIWTVILKIKDLKPWADAIMCFRERILLRLKAHNVSRLNGALRHLEPPFKESLAVLKIIFSKDVSKIVSIFPQLNNEKVWSHMKGNTILWKDYRLQDTAKQCLSYWSDFPTHVPWHDKHNSCPGKIQEKK